jgi:superoxide dismutase, Fe-Mn family
MNRKNFLQKSIFSVLAFSSFKGFSFKSSYNDSLKKMTLSEVLAETAPYTLAALPYGVDALEPHIDKMTMEIHHGRHHKAYIDNLNKALLDKPEAKMSLEELIRNAGKMLPLVRNNAGGHWNHTFFWSIMAPKAGGMPTGNVAAQITKQYGTLDKFKEEFTKAATSRFGSGWAWLTVEKGGNLTVSSTPNQENPMMDISEKKGMPILGLDVWEHAYYLKYQNKRGDYVTAFWNLVNWTKVEELYNTSK